MKKQKKYRVVYGFVIIVVWMLIYNAYSFQVHNVFLPKSVDALYVFDTYDIGVMTLCIYLFFVLIAYVTHRQKNCDEFQKPIMGIAVTIISLLLPLLFVNYGSVYTKGNRLEKISFNKIVYSNTIEEAKSAKVVLLYYGDSSVPWDGVRLQYYINFNEVSYCFESSDDYQYWQTIKKIDEIVSENSIPKEIVGAEYLPTLKRFSDIDKTLNKPFGVYSNYDLIFEIMTNNQSDQSGDGFVIDTVIPWKSWNLVIFKT